MGIAGDNLQAASLNHIREGTGQLVEGTPPKRPRTGLPTPSPMPSERQDVDPSTQDAQLDMADASTMGGMHVERSTNYVPRARGLMLFGGIKIPEQTDIGAEINMIKPLVPNLEEMGVLDIQTLTLSIQSGIHAEVRYALDHLAKLSFEPRVQLELDKCDDLLDGLMDCAEVQVDKLAAGAVELPRGEASLLSYEDVIRECRLEIETLQDIPEFGTAEWDRGGAAERLIAVTTILRNLSFSEANHSLLTSTPVIKFMSKTIRFMGERHLLLRTHMNTQDFMKDLVILLSNVAYRIELDSRDDTLNILRFLLAFAPRPQARDLLPGSRPTSLAWYFSPYVPSQNRYLPPAVDALAKLLAQDEPNRLYFRQLFAADPSHVLLTRTFSLAVAVLPDHTRYALTPQEMRVAEARLPSLAQGMLAADILASMVPGPESGVARTWLEAEDAWAPGLLRLCLLANSPQGPQQQQQQQQQNGVGVGAKRTESSDTGFAIVSQRALAMLKTLVEKSGGYRGIIDAGDEQGRDEDVYDIDGGETCQVLDGSDERLEGQQGQEARKRSKPEVGSTTENRKNVAGPGSTGRSPTDDFVSLSTEPGLSNSAAIPRVESDATPLTNGDLHLSAGVDAAPSSGHGQDNAALPTAPPTPPITTSFNKVTTEESTTANVASDAKHATTDGAANNNDDDKDGAARSPSTASDTKLGKDHVVKNVSEKMRTRSSSCGDIIDRLKIDSSDVDDNNERRALVGNVGLKGDVLLKRETVLGALLLPGSDATIVRLLCALAGVDQ